MLNRAAKDAGRLFWLRFSVAAIVLIVGTVAVLLRYL